MKKLQNFGDRDWLQWKVKYTISNADPAIVAGTRLFNVSLEFPNIQEFDGMYLFLKTNDNPGTLNFIRVPFMAQLIQFSAKTIQPYTSGKATLVFPGAATIPTDKASASILYYDANTRSEILPIYYRAEQVNLIVMNLATIPQPGVGITTDIELYIMLHKKISPNG